MKRADIVKLIASATTGAERKFHLAELREYDLNSTDTLVSNLTDFHGDFKSLDEKAKDEIINPAHYQVIPSGTYPQGLEYMDLMTYILAHHNGVESHLLGQILKYSIRLGKKDDKLQDAKKIQWYANYLVKIIEQEDES